MERFRFPVSERRRSGDVLPVSTVRTLLALQEAGIEKLKGSTDKDRVASWCESISGGLDAGVRLLTISYVPEKSMRAGEIHRLEAHRHHIDIQICLTGSEGIAIAPISNLSGLEPWNEKDDVEFGTAPVNEIHVLSFPDAFVLLPRDAHMGGVPTDPGTPILKIVVKVDLNA